MSIPVSGTVLSHRGGRTLVLWLWYYPPGRIFPWPFSDGGRLSPDNRRLSPLRRRLSLPTDRGPFQLPSACFRHKPSPLAPFYPRSSAKTPSFSATPTPNNEKPPPSPPSALPSGQTSPAAVSGRHCRGCLYHPFCPVLRPLDGRGSGLGRLFTRSTQV
jgi:hypothetical protein